MAVSRRAIQSPWTGNAIPESGLGRRSRDGCPPERHIKYGLDSGQDEWGVSAPGKVPLAGGSLPLSCQWEPWLGFTRATGFSTPEMSSMLLLSPKCYFPSEKLDHRTECHDEHKYN